MNHIVFRDIDSEATSFPGPRFDSEEEYFLFLFYFSVQTIYTKNIGPIFLNTY